MWKKRSIAGIVLLVGIGIGYLTLGNELFPTLPHTEFSKKPFHLGLDLRGGTHLVYRADVSAIAQEEITDSMNALRDVIERRINLFGVSEPVVQIQKATVANQGEERLNIDLPGVTDISEAIEMIGETPFLEFKTERPEGVEKDALIEAFILALETNPNVLPSAIEDPYYVSTALTGRYLSRATLQFDPTTQMPIIGLEFNNDGAVLFEEITRANVGKTVAIYLDGSPISSPVVNDVITGGQAQITGQFTPQEAKELVGRLNSGALPVPIELISTQTIGATLGEEATKAGLMAGMIGFIAITVFLLVWYRLPGLIAVLALSIYVILMLFVTKFIPITLTAAGIAGFIISMGMAVDANILIFERIKEELRLGKTIHEAIATGFSRAWFSIRDANTSSLITAAILFWFGSSLIKGFALTFGLGVIISLISAITVTRIFLNAVSMRDTKFTSFLFGSGFSSARVKAK